jgi:hypothetical protein
MGDPQGAPPAYLSGTEGSPYEQPVLVPQSRQV